MSAHAAWNFWAQCGVVALYTWLGRTVCVPLLGLQRWISFSNTDPSCMWGYVQRCTAGVAWRSSGACGGLGCRHR